MEGVPQNTEDIEALRAEMLEIKSKIYLDLDLYDKMAERVQELQKKYPDYKDYELYHIISGSTMEGSRKKFDFPGKDSLVKFLRSL